MRVVEALYEVLRLIVPIDLVVGLVHRPVQTAIMLAGLTLELDRLWESP